MNLLANRSDCYAIFNVAKELGALFSRKVTLPAVEDDHTFESDFVVGSETDKCKEFAIKEVRGIKIKESPSWLKNVLRSEGIKSINNIVDLGNYIMLLTGQPLHMYDSDKLPKHQLIVKDDLNLKYVALDSKVHDILSGDLVVTSNGDSMCIAGILGGENSEISNTTTNIAIEAAIFDHVSIRKTCTRLGLSSDSSQRFIKGLNKDQTDYVLNLTTKLLKEVSGYDSISNIVKYDCLVHEDIYISSSKTYINNRLGTSFSFDEIKNVLSSLYFKFVEEDGDNFKVLVPKERIDIEGEADLSEEVIRYIGIDNIPSTLPFMETTVGGRNLNEEKEKVISDFLSNNGLYRVITYTLINKKQANSFNYLNKGLNYVIKNPLTEDHMYVRTNLLSSLLEATKYNLNHQNKNFGLYEISKVDTEKGVEDHLAIVLSGKKYLSDEIVDRDYSYYDVKGIVDYILNAFNISSSRIKYSRIEKGEEFHPNRSALITLDNKPLVVMGDIYPTLKDSKDPLILLEMNLSLLFATKSKNNKFEPISSFPQSSRDYAFLLDDSISYLDVKREIKKCSSLIKDVHLFDVYKGSNIIKNHKSIALTVTFESFDHTLKENEIEEANAKIVETLSKKFNVNLRS